MFMRIEERNEMKRKVNPNRTGPLRDGMDFEIVETEGIVQDCKENVDLPPRCNERLLNGEGRNTTPQKGEGAKYAPPPISPVHERVKADEEREKEHNRR